MEISNTTNNYQLQNAEQQKSVTTPVEPPKEQAFNNKEIYEASQGNAIRNESGELALTPQGQTNLGNAQDANAEEAQAAATEQKDAQRATATDYLAHQSQKSQVEIYLAVATDGQAEIGSNGDTASIIETLRDVQKQNNTVAAYATYQENQDGAKPALL